MATRILIVDDSAESRRNLIEVLQPFGEFLPIGWAENGIDVLTKVPLTKPDVVIMDLDLPLLNGLDTLAELMSTTPVPVVILSSSGPQGALATLKAFEDRKSTRLNSSHVRISYAVFCLKKKNRI